MFHKQHAVDLYESAEKALARAEVMAQHRHRERKAALTALRREQFLGDQTAAQNANDAAAKRGDAADGASVLPEDAAASLNKARASKLRSELAKLEAVSGRMLGRLAVVDADDEPSEEHLLLPHLPQTLTKVRAAVPAVAAELPSRLDDLFLALAFASVVHDGGSVDGIGALDAVLTQEQVQSLRLRALHTFATRGDVGDIIAEAHPTVVRLALSTPSYRIALADRISNVRKAWDERQRSSPPEGGCEPGLPRMRGSFVAVAKALLPTDPTMLVDFIEGSVVPGLLPHLDHTNGSIFPTPSDMHRHLYDATMRPEFAEVVRLAERHGGVAAQAAMDLEAAIDAARHDDDTGKDKVTALEAELEAKVHHAAACGDVIDLTRTLLYRGLLSVEQLVQRRRNLATAEDSQAPGSVATGVTSRRRAGGGGGGDGNERAAAMVDVAQATSSVGAAQSHRSLSSLIEQAADQQGLSVMATTRSSLAGHEILDLETAAGVPVVAYYVHRGSVFAARYQRPSGMGQRAAAPAPNGFTELEGGAVELIALGAAAARKL